MSCCKGYVVLNSNYAVVFFQVMLAGPPGALVPAEVLVGKKALLWPRENAGVPQSAALERVDEKKTASMFLVVGSIICAHWHM